jgi:hypothetical protein
MIAERKANINFLSQFHKTCFGPSERAIDLNKYGAYCTNSMHNNCGCEERFFVVMSVLRADSRDIMSAALFFILISLLFCC